MKLSYSALADSLYIDLVDRPSVDSREIKPGVVLDFDAEDNLVGIDIDHASKVIDLSRLEIESLPATSVGLVA
ncbi:MAG: DUF2283 domain-containing protein [Armatimonadota bacterium]|nr:DUF2283 domain-containing protein [Armatimonadota bacterium]